LRWLDFAALVHCLCWAMEECLALCRRACRCPPLPTDALAPPFRRCAGPVLTIAAARAHGRSVFVSPPDKRSEAEAARRKLAPAAYAYRSDHLALVAAFAGWEAARRQGGRRAAAEFASQNFVSDQASRVWGVLLMW
jgi:HrpA-like RNA helicase